MTSTTTRFWSGYRVDEDGNIYNKNGTLKKLSKSRKGYPLVGFCFNGISKTYAVHKIVAKVFHGDPIDSNMQVDHIDNDPANFHPSNLRYVSASENVKKAYDQGRKNHSGFKAGASRYTSEDFITVLGLIKCGYVNRYIKDITLMGIGTIKNLRNGTHFYVREGQV